MVHRRDLAVRISGWVGEVSSEADHLKEHRAARQIDTIAWHRNRATELAAEGYFTAAAWHENEATEIESES